MNKLTLLTIPVLASVGCVPTKQQTVNNSTPIYYQAYDAKWDDPTINPIFDNEWEAKDYASRNNMGSKYAQDTSHSYVVRVVNHRYEVRQVNDVNDDILHTTNEFNDAYEYVVEYSSAHSDLIIYDLKTGKQYEETP